MDLCIEFILMSKKYQADNKKKTVGIYSVDVKQLENRNRYIKMARINIFLRFNLWNGTLWRIQMHIYGSNCVTICNAENAFFISNRKNKIHGCELNSKNLSFQNLLIFIFINPHKNNNNFNVEGSFVLGFQFGMQCLLVVKNPTSCHQNVKFNSLCNKSQSQSYPWQLHALLT